MFQDNDPGAAANPVETSGYPGVVHNETTKTTAESSALKSPAQSTMSPIPGINVPGMKSTTTTGIEGRAPQSSGKASGANMPTPTGSPNVGGGVSGTKPRGVGESLRAREDALRARLKTANVGRNRRDLVLDRLQEIPQEALAETTTPSYPWLEDAGLVVGSGLLGTAAGHQVGKALGTGQLGLTLRGEPRQRVYEQYGALGGAATGVAVAAAAIAISRARNREKTAQASPKPVSKPVRTATGETVANWLSGFPAKMDTLRRPWTPEVLRGIRAQYAATKTIPKP